MRDVRPIWRVHASFCELVWECAEVVEDVNSKKMLFCDKLWASWGFGLCARVTGDKPWMALLSICERNWKRH